jgi:hypothetical protein
LFDGGDALLKAQASHVLPVEFLDFAEASGRTHNSLEHASILPPAAA